MHKNTGHWSHEEHQKFLKALDLYGKNWKKVEEYIGTRNTAQARSHAQKFFGKYFEQFNNGELKDVFAYQSGTEDKFLKLQKHSSEKYIPKQNEEEFIQQIYNDAKCCLKDGLQLAKLESVSTTYNGDEISY